MASYRVVYLVLITILCISAGIISLEFDEVKYKQLVSKIFTIPSDDAYFASDSFADNSSVIDRNTSKLQTHQNCNLQCVQKNVCVNGSVIANGANLLSPRMSIRVGANDESDCGNKNILCCLKEDADYDADSENEIDNYDDVSDELISQTHDEPMKMNCGYRYHRNGREIVDRISSDDQTHFGEFPWMMAIWLRYANGFLYRGGGSLIHPRAVLTAAHILVNRLTKNWLVRAGEWDMKDTNEELGHQDRNVSNIIVHPRFEASTFIHDIALLIVAVPFELTWAVNTICLPPHNFLPEHNTKCTASGWGKNQFGRGGEYQSVMKKVELPIVAIPLCQQRLRRTRLGQFFRLHRSLICAGGRNGDDTCDGDGGSPLTCQLPHSPSRFYQTGIVAAGKAIRYRSELN